MTDSIAQQLDRVKLSIYGYDRSGPITVEWTSFDELRDKVAAMEAENAELKQKMKRLDNPMNIAKVSELDLLAECIRRLEE